MPCWSRSPTTIFSSLARTTETIAIVVVPLFWIERKSTRERKYNHRLKPVSQNRRGREFLLEGGGDSNGVKVHDQQGQPANWITRCAVGWYVSHPELNPIALSLMVIHIYLLPIYIYLSSCISISHICALACVHTCLHTRTHAYSCILPCTFFLCRFTRTPRYTPVRSNRPHLILLVRGFSRRGTEYLRDTETDSRYNFTGRLSSALPSSLAEQSGCLPAAPTANQPSLSRNRIPKIFPTFP